MATLILLYSRSSKLHGAELADAVQRTATGLPFRFAWSLGGTAGAQTKAQVGDRAFLYAQGNVSPRSHQYRLFASGRLVETLGRSVELADGQRRRVADVDWDVVLPPATGVPREVLVERVPRERWDRRFYGDVVAEAASAVALEEVWQEHLRLQRQRCRP